ncbi:LPO_1073/Vpar_1526 family protein [Streptomyces sp. NPDC048208]|uniref:LPO_1073/Vpar_1526 family protein n=1 Tax=Streptomyces sp. NPDC048208 TaxID=3365515 RepID=UPI0037108A13
MRQEQRGGDNSTNFQAEVIHAGITYRDARDIATDVYNDNIPKFTEIARQVALDRAMSFTDTLLDGIPSETLQALKDPDVQRALFFAQQEFACSGDEQLGDVLMDLMRKRMKSPQRDIKQLAVTESLKTAPKLSANHFSALTALFVLTRIRLGIASVADLHAKMRTILAPAVYGLEVSEADLAYLEYAGCVSIQITSHNIGDILLETYKGAFSRGFTEEQIPETVRPVIAPFLGACFRDPAKLQLAALNAEIVGKLTEEQKLDDPYRASILNLLNVGLMSSAEAAEEFSDLHPALRNLTEIYHSSSLKNCQLTTVGITLAHTNLRRVAGEAFDPGLEIWVK